jgi:hypothetical protein
MPFSGETERGGHAEPAKYLELITAGRQLAIRRTKENKMLTRNIITAIFCLATMSTYADYAYAKPVQNFVVKNAQTNGSLVISFNDVTNLSELKQVIRDHYLQHKKDEFQYTVIGGSHGSGETDKLGAVTPGCKDQNIYNEIDGWLHGDRGPDLLGADIVLWGYSTLELGTKIHWTDVVSKLNTPPPGSKNQAVVLAWCDSDKWFNQEDAAGGGKKRLGGVELKLRGTVGSPGFR